MSVFDTGRWPEGHAACLALLHDHALPDVSRELIYAIQAEFARPLPDLVPSATPRALNWPASEGAAPRDPSPVVVGERLLVFGRAGRSSVNDRRLEPPGVVLTLDGDFAIATVAPLADEAGAADRYDEVRPFLLGDHLHVAFVVYDPDADDWPQAGIAAIDGGAYRRPRLLGPRVGNFAQGWAPIATPDGPRFLAWWEPTEVFSLDPSLGTFAREALRRTSRVTERFWSGSQGVMTPGGYLLLVNETATLGDLAEVVTTRFAFLDRGFRLAGISPPFFVAEHGSDVATGLARQGDRLVAGFSSEDTSALLVTMDLSEVLSSVTPI